MKMFIRLLLAAALILPATVASAGPTTQPATRWQASWLAYTAPKDRTVEITTPTAAQLDYKRGSAVVRLDNKQEIHTTEGPVEPATMGPLAVRHLIFRDADGALVPALLCTPKQGKGPFPVVIAIHGLGSNKAQVCAQVGASFIKQGFAVLAPDMPMHGERPGDLWDMWARKDVLAGIHAYRDAVTDVRECIDIAATLPDLDISNGVMLAGYSMGSFIDSVAGPADPRVKAMVLMVGGAFETNKFASVFPGVAVIDPLLAIAHFAGRPILMLNGAHDSTITREMTNRLYAAAAQPKEQRWYDSDHLLPTKAYDDAGEWLAKTWARLLAQKHD